MTTNSSLSARKSPFAGLQPASAWIAIFALTLFTIACIAAGAGKILNIAFPAASLAVGVFLYYRAPLLYVGFNWWLWFLVAFIRRVSDYRSSFTDPSPMLLAPYLVSLVSVITLWKKLPNSGRQGGLPFVLAVVGVMYGFGIGLIEKSPFIVARSLLDWLSPLSFGFYLFANWRDYPSYRNNVQRIFVWGVLIMGIYGVYQFVSLPDWDRKWLIESNFVSASGDPDQEAPRIWSTMQAGEPFAAVMAGALLLLLTMKGPLVLPASVAGYMSFLLALVRASWLGWLAGLLALIGSAKAKLQMRLVAIVLIMGLCVVPLASMEPFADRINARLTTLSNVKEDDSAAGRQDSFNNSIGKALTTVVGEGIGGGSLDNTILAMFFYLGWLGTLPYFGGLLLLVFKLFLGSNANSFDPFTGAARAIVVSGLVRIPVNGPNTGVSGVMLWGFLAMGLAADKYYQHQRLKDSDQS